MTLQTGWSRVLVLMLAANLWITAAGAAEALAATNPTGSDLLRFPSALRVFLGFTLTAGLFVTIAWVMRWIAARYGSRSAIGKTVRVHSRSRPATGLLLTVVEVDGQRLLITESRHGLHVLPLPDGKVADDA